MKKVCFFGIYYPGYSRIRVLRQAFTQNGYSIVECRVDPRKTPGIKKYISLLKLGLQARKEKFDHVVVCFPGQGVAPLARMVFGREIIFDAFLSLYDSNVCDRKAYPKYHIRAWRDWFLDWLSSKVSRFVLLDTKEHIKYFSKTFYVPEHKMLRFLVSADEEVFFPQGTSVLRNPLVVHFHGMFIPLQGVRYILDAASILRDKNIKFRIIGIGQEYKKMRSYAEFLGLTNVEFVDKVPIEELPKYIAESYVCLGIFGDTEKTGRVIPNKVYECVAMGKPVITADTAAIKEVFSDRENVLLCKVADGVSLAEAIERLINDPVEARNIGENARQLFESKLKAKTIGRELITKITNE